jgi:hypothetical protein
MSYTPEEAEPMIPIAVRQVALSAVRALISLDKYPVNSREFERCIYTIEGSVGHLVKLCVTVWKSGKGTNKLASPTL